MTEIEENIMPILLDIQNSIENIKTTLDNINSTTERMIKKVDKTNLFLVQTYGIIPIPYEPLGEFNQENIKRLQSRIKDYYLKDKLN